MPEREPFDVAVIGAGINGAGIARDAAMRGLRVVVLEQNDSCSGTSAWSSRLIHGGLRYLEYGEIPLVFESLHERRTLRKIAPHLVKPIRICIPVYAGARRGPWLVRLGMLAYDLLSIGKAMPSYEMHSRAEMLANEPGLAEKGLRAAACYYDAQVTFAERLVIENLLAARAAGADIRTYHQVTGMNIVDGRISTLELKNTLDGTRSSVEARAVINAAGPWVDDVLGTAAGAIEPLIGGTKGSHIAVEPFDGCPDDAFYVEAAADSRPIFIIPWNGMYLIGTTDIRYDGDLSNTRASRAEIDYLLDETNRVFPRANLSLDDIRFAYAGVRPLPRRTKGPESSITRRHIIKKNREIAAGLISIIGGKLTTYRNLAEQCVDRLGRLLRQKLPDCRTADAALPGATHLSEASEALQSITSLSERGRTRLLDLYGGRSMALARLATTEVSLSHCIDNDGRVLAAEVIFVIREEMARTLADIVHRRMMLGFDPDQGRPLYASIAALAAAEFDWSDSETRSALDSLKAYSDSFLPPD
ncbi:MAG: glycerol-3-phosphate dehydrogenase [Gammaproteobacteria bacterium]|nr:glycerol-3-phosphate dehydrogenase [Gammaproteobacteria bacterium]